MSEVLKALEDLHNSVKLLLGLAKDETVPKDQVTLKDEAITSERLTSLSQGITDLTTKCLYYRFKCSNLLDSYVGLLFRNTESR
jgi:hypothetical protein